MDEPTPRELLIASLKGAFSGHQIVDIQIAMFKEEEEARVTIPAVRLGGPWALHLDMSGIGWICVHIPTGFGIRRFNSLAQSLMSLGVLLAADLPWESVTTAAEFSQLIIDNEGTAKAIRKALGAVRDMDVIG